MVRSQSIETIYGRCHGVAYSPAGVRQLTRWRQRLTVAIALTGVRFQLKSGRTSAPRLPQAWQTNRGSRSGFVSEKYTAGLEMLCPGGACFKLGSPAGLNRSKLNAKLM